MYHVVRTQPSDPGSLVFLIRHGRSSGFPPAGNLPIPQRDSGLDIPTDFCGDYSCRYSPGLAPGSLSPPSERRRLPSREQRYAINFYKSKPFLQKKESFFRISGYSVYLCSRFGDTISIRTSYKRESGANPEQCPLL